MSRGDRLELRKTGETELLGVSRYLLFSGFPGLALPLLVLAGAAAGEAR